MGREKFIEVVEKFAAESHDTIVNQVKRMGSSLDWSREAYTMDEPREIAVRTAFKRMYDAGLIYRGSRIVNWDPKLQTTVSDDEVEHVEETVPFYYFKYGPFTIGTVRPETKFGDKYVLIHPDDKRYSEYKHRQEIDVEWINGPIKATIIKDEAVDMEIGSGVMTITPAHSSIDFEIAQRHNLDIEQVIDERGLLLPIAGEFEGQHIKKARPLILEKMKAQGLIEKIDEDYTHNLATNSRGGGIIEPQIKEQWWVDVNKKIPERGDRSLKELMHESVSGGAINIIPDRFEKVYFNWIDNLRDWNISRQLWFGHQIPVWYDKAGKIYTEREQRILFVRHGEAENNKQNLVGGQKDFDITDKGRKQAKKTGVQLKDKSIVKIISSDLSRCHETAKIIAREIGFEEKDIELWKELRETDAGDVDGTPEIKGITALERALTETTGESLEDIRKRAQSVVKKLGNIDIDGDVLVVSHCSFSSAVFAMKKGVADDQIVLHRRAWDMQNGTVKNMVFLKEPSEKGLTRDPDTLDTWFSSGLWSFSTLGWPDGTQDLETYHPTSVMGPGYEIIFFWVARMILMSTFLLDDIPFKTVYLHGMLRDSQGRKFSKSLNNGIDPIDIIDKYGADALRMSLIVGIGPGNDSKFDEQKVRAYTKFANKLWNISRYVLDNTTKYDTANKPRLSPLDEKDLKKFNELIEEVTVDFESHKLYLASEKLYHYIWHNFADEIIEESKEVFQDNESFNVEMWAKKSRAWLIYYILENSLKLLHPFMPFITEEIWQSLPQKERDILMISRWPNT